MNHEALSLFFAACTTLPIGSTCSVDYLAAHKAELGIEWMSECFAIFDGRAGRCRPEDLRDCHGRGPFIVVAGNGKPGDHPYDVWVCLKLDVPSVPIS